MIPDLCELKHYDYIVDIISTNTKPTQEYFLFDHLIKRRRPYKHYVKAGLVDPIIGLDVPSGNSPIESEMVENTPIFKPNLQEQTRLNYNQEPKIKFQKCDKLITDKKFVMKIILDRCDEETRVEIALNSSYEDIMETRELIKFLTQVRKICNDTKDNDVFFGSRLTKITKHQF